VEKRKYERIPKRLAVRFGTGQPDDMGFTGDLSRSGLFIKTNTVFSPGESLRIKVTLPDSRILDLVGEVMWAKRVSPSMIRHVKKSGMGIQLVDIPKGFSDFVESVESGQEVKPPPAAMPEDLVGEDTSKKEEEKVELSEKEISEACNRLGDQDYYQVLGAPRDASFEEIKRYFYKRARQFHPDRYHHRESKELKGQLQALFGRINEAYRTLSSEDARRRYDLDLVTQKTGGPPRGEPVKTSLEDLVRKGRAAPKDRNPKAATHFFEQAVQSNPSSGPYRTLLAQALSQIPNRRRDAEFNYKKAIDIAPAQVENYIGLGTLYKQAGLRDRALKQFEQALVWDPDNSQATKEIRLLKDSQ
jgi:curved DNA-binding protein CbpA/Tfp pilus assembly protein PilZ